MDTHNDPHTNSSLSGELILRTKVNSARCYQCGKCSAGCPLADDMDITSSAVMRLLQTEEAAADMELLRSKTIWLCASCEMCISRCPMEIDIPKVMDFLRQKSLAAGLADRSSNRKIVAFHKSFLDVVRLTGRSYEIGLVADYKMRSMRLFQDLAIAPKMFFRGKLPLFPEMVKGRKNIGNIFKASKPQTNEK